ncbi:MAG: hypothetical protein LRY27_00885 [Chitinophagales bacterium]|nr:hypothetical protein [Chitinophagales bacterium]
MLKYISALALTVLVFFQVHACDACACTSMNTLNGQLVPSNKSLFGLHYSYTNQVAANNKRINNFSYSLFAGVSFAKRWQLLLNLPLQQR